MIKAIVGVIVVAALGVGGWWYMNRNANNQAMIPDQMTTQDANSQASAQPDANAPQSNATTNSGTTVTMNDSSDASLQQDSDAIDAQMSGLDSDNASTDSGLSSQ